MNRVVLIGRLARDPELRTTSTGKNVVEFTIAVDRRIKNADTNADFFRVKAWAQTAEYVAKYLGKGRQVAVDGRLEVRKFTDKDNNQREITEVVAENVVSLDKPKDQPKQSSVDSTNADDYDPFGDE
jgi:single-strand DNA-binding protein